MSKVLRTIKNPRLLLIYILRQYLAGFVSDETYLKWMFYLRMGKKLNLQNPQTFNEKCQWLKLYDRNPEYTKMVDKIEAKKFASKIIGEEHIIPTIGVFNNVDEIDFDSLPKQFVLKCSHDSGGIVICQDKTNLNIPKSRIIINHALKTSYYLQHREWPYKNVKPRIIIEKYMKDDDGELPDYKFFCFNGKPEYMFIATDRFTEGEETKFDFYDMNFNHLPFTNGHPNSSKKIEKPKGFDEMVDLASKLSTGIPHVRVDLYDINGHIYFGEMTFTHWSGFVPFEPEEWDYKFGEKIKLPTPIYN